MRKPRLSLWNLKSEWGTTLVETAIAVGILGVTAMGMTQFFSQNIKLEKQNKIKAAMEFLAQDIENKLKTPSSIYLSLLDGNNLSLSQCILGWSTGCTAALTTPGSQNPFALNYDVGLNQIGKRLTNPTSVALAYYDVNGLPCNRQQTPLTCVFTAETFFYATCDPTEATFPTCLYGPAEVHVGYSVKKLAGTLTSYSSTIFKNLPTNPRFFTHQTKNILGITSNSTCPIGSVITGYDRRGYPSCECKSPYIQQGNLRYGPRCVLLTANQLKCADGLIYRGISSNGTAMCENPYQAYSCIDANPVADLGAKCPAGYWVMQDYRPSTPRPVPYNIPYQNSWWEDNGVYPPAGCYFSCTLPDIRGGSWDCGSSELGDNRYDGGMQGSVTISGNISDLYNTIDVSDTENSPANNRNNAVYKKGLVCPSRKLMCCTQSD